MTQMDLFQTATSSPQDTPVSPSHLPGSAEAQKMTDISGRTYFPLFKEKDPLSAFSRMFMGTSLWVSTKCFLTWKGKATQQGRSLFQLVPLTHHTDETDSGLSVEMWPTPTTQEIEHPDAELTASGRRLSKDKKSSHSLNLADRVKMWPTPTAHISQEGAYPAEFRRNTITLTAQAAMEDQKMWPTPTARDYKDSGDNMNLYRNERQNTQLGVVAKRSESESSGSLNPEWVEWLMGYPEGWTDLKD